MADRESGRTRWVSAAGTGAVLMAALSFLPIVQGMDWWAASVVFAALAVTATGAARALGLPAFAAALVGTAAIPLLATAVAGQGQGFALVLPTAASSDAVMRTVLDAEAQIYADSVPATPTAGIVLLIACGVALAAVLVDTVAVGLRAPLGAMPVIIALAIVPGKALRTGTSGWLLVAVAIAALMLIAADRRRRRADPRVGGLVLAAAAAAVLTVVAQAVLPVPATAQADALPVQPLFGPGADPLIRLGDNLRRGPRAPVLSYTTTSHDPVYLRLAVLERFTGTTWRPNAADGVPLVPGSAPVAPGVAADEGRPATTTVRASAPEALGVRLPLPYPATSVDGAVGYTWDAQGLTLQRLDRATPATRYAVKSLDLDRPASALRAAGTGAVPGDNAAVGLPKDVPARIRSITAAWTRGATGPYEKALAIQNHLRAFDYDQDAPSRLGYEGDGLRVIEKFLQARSGYCVHFASAMAVMARIEGIPSRVVVGYQPGERTGRGAAARYAVSSDDLHSWPELYLTGLGWTRFEPTPGRGAVPAYAPQPKTGPNASATPTAGPSRGVASSAPSDAAAARADRAGGGPAAVDPLDVLRPLGAVGALAALLAVPGLLRFVLRRRRLARLDRPGSPRRGWQEVLDTAADLGVPPPVDRSPRTVAAALAERLPAGAGAAALDRLRSAVEMQTYADRPERAERADVVAVLDGLWGASPRPTRIRAALAPVSLLGTLDASRLAFRWSPPGSDAAGEPAAGSAARLGRSSAPSNSTSRGNRR